MTRACWSRVRKPPQNPPHWTVFTEYRDRIAQNWSTVCAVSGNRSVYRMATPCLYNYKLHKESMTGPLSQASMRNVHDRIYETKLHRSVLWTTNSVTVIMLLVSRVQWSLRNINYKGRPCKRLTELLRTEIRVQLHCDSLQCTVYLTEIRFHVIWKRLWSTDWSAEICYIRTFQLSL